MDHRTTRRGWIVGALLAAASGCDDLSAFDAAEDVPAVDVAADRPAAPGVDAGVAGIDAPTVDDAVDAAEKPADAGEPDAVQAPADVGGRDVAARDLVFSTCLAVDIGSALGVSVATGNSVEGTTEYYAGCGGELASESTVTWTAPANGDFTFSTEGSEYDTLMYVREDGCEGPELDCNDDPPDAKGTPWSELTLRLHGGQRVAVFIDGHGLEGGAWTLSIAAGGAFDAGAP
ncbi:MAG: hypothetical protein JWM10_624 [Myxococcaceae bacterium]|nr:hypothetical protein [Myxococcaceae bacterium]